MKKLEISIDSDTLQGIVLENLRNEQCTMQKSYKDRKNGIGNAIFDNDPKKDSVKIENLVQSFDEVIEYYSPHSEEKNKTVLEVKENQDGDVYIELPDSMLKELGWHEGDTLAWHDNLNGSFTLKKQSTEWVLVDTISQFRMRYLVEVPKGKAEHALDTVTMGQAKEFSQTHLGEQIVSNRVVSEKDALEIFDQDNDYLKTWDKDLKIKKMFTSMQDLKNLDQKSEE